MTSAASALVWHHSEAEGAARLVALAIADHDGEGGAWPSIGTIARMAKVSESTARRGVRTLVALEEVEVITNGGGSARTPEHLRPNRYEILIVCPEWCDRGARHRCRHCRESGSHKKACPAVDNPTTDPLSPVTPPVMGDTPPPVTGDTPPPVTAVTPKPPKELPKEETPPTPPQRPTLPESVAQLWTGEGISDEDQHALWAAVLDDPETNVPAARARQRSWFVPTLARIHAATRKTLASHVNTIRQFGTPCEHGEPGGADDHPTTGLPICPLCRAEVLRHA